MNVEEMRGEKRKKVIIKGERRNRIRNKRSRAVRREKSRGEKGRWSEHGQRVEGRRQQLGSAFQRAREIPGAGRGRREPHRL